MKNGVGIELASVVPNLHAKCNAINNLWHMRYEGGHALTQERFDAIIGWILENGKSI